jgi:hypothetical protein
MVFCKVKNLYYFGGEILYPEILNDQSKLLNNLFMSKSYKKLNFMIF